MLQNFRALLCGAVAFGALSAMALPAFAEAVLHKGNGGEPSSLDPSQISINIEGFIAKDLFEGLTVYDAAGIIVPGAAESWKISDDGLTYTFKIRAGAKWSDGSDLTAEDFVYSLRRVQDPKTASKYANILHPIKGAEKANKGEGKLEDIGVKAIDAKTLEITLERPTPYFLELLSHYTALPVNKASIEKNGAEFTKPGKLVSNGAYKLEAHTPNDSLTIVKNAGYWDAANVKIDKVVIYPIEDPAAMVRRFEAKEVDMVYNFSAADIERLRKAHGDQVHVSPALATYYYVFDNRKKPFDDVRVRRALSMAVDRDFLSKEIYKGAQLPTYSLVPPGMGAYGEPAKADFAGLSQLDREDKAVALMKEAGYGDGGKPLTLEIRYNTNPNHERVATAVADMWKKTFGAKVTMTNLDVSSHYAYLQEAGSFDVARAGWSADYADAENFLTLAYSGNPAFNYGKYNNPKYDALIKSSYEERDAEKRQKILKEAEAMLMNDQPLAPFLNSADLWLVASRVKGFKDNAANEHLTRFMSISE